jgi:hypothetical protein
MVFQLLRLHNKEYYGDCRNDELESISKEAVMVYFKGLSQQLAGEAKENHTNSRLARTAGLRTESRTQDLQNKECQTIMSLGESEENHRSVDEIVLIQFFLQ